MKERNHADESNRVAAESAPVPPSIHPVGIEDLPYGVVPLPNEVEIHQVDRSPGRKEIEQDGQKLAKLGDEVTARIEGQYRGDHSHSHEAYDALASGWLDGLAGIEHTQECQG